MTHSFFLTRRISPRGRILPVAAPTVAAMPLVSSLALAERWRARPAGQAEFWALLGPVGVVTACVSAMARAMALPAWEPCRRGPASGRAT